MFVMKIPSVPFSVFQIDAITKGISVLIGAPPWKRHRSLTLDT
jgi:hypothetical protein